MISSDLELKALVERDILKASNAELIYAMQYIIKGYKANGSCTECFKRGAIRTILLYYRNKKLNV